MLLPWGLKNFSVFAAHKNMPGALEVIINDPQLNVDALILPGHVSTIIGAEPYRFLAEKYGIPGVITGFEPVDVLQGIAMIMRQLHEGRAEIEIAYARGVMPEGNPVALAAIDEVFETCTATWRGLGPIEGSGYRIRAEFAQFDAVKRFEPEVEPTQDRRAAAAATYCAASWRRTNARCSERSAARRTRSAPAWSPAKAAARRTIGTTSATGFIRGLILAIPSSSRHPSGARRVRKAS